MANLPISGLTASASNLASTDLAPVVQTVGVGPVKMTGLQLAGGLLGSTTFNGSTVTTSSPVLNLTQTWNAGAVTFTGLKFNVTNTASSSSSKLIDLQVNTNSAFAVQNIGGGAPTIGLNIADGSAYYGTLLSSGSTQVAYFGATSTAGYAFALNGSYYLGFYAPGSFDVTSTPDLRLSRAAAATLQLGAADAAGSAIAINSVASNQLTLASNHGLSNGAAVIITGTAAPSGTTLNTLYYARSISAAVLELYDTYENAITTSGTTGRVSVTTAGTSASVRLSTPFQTFQPQSFTGTDIPGQPFIIKGSRGTGTGAGGSIIFQVAPAGSSGTAQNAYSTAMSLNAVAGSSPYAILGVGTASVYYGFQIQTGGYAGGACFVGDTPTQGTVFGVHPAFAFAWANNNATPTATYDLFVRRDNSNILALRNGTNAQLFRVYSTYNGTNDAYGAIGAGVKLDGTYASGDENILYIGSQKKGSPTALTKLALQVDGTTRVDYNITTGSTWTFSGAVGGITNLTLSGYVIAPGGLYYAASGTQASAYDFYSIGGGRGHLLAWNSGSSAQPIVAIGGTTSSFPALKRSTTTLQVRLADDSAFGSFQTGGFSGGAPTIKTANYTQLEADYSLIFNGTGSITLTLLAAATYPGKILYVKTIAAQTVVSASSNVKPIDTDTAGTAILAATAGKWAMLQSDGTDWVIMAQG